MFHKFLLCGIFALHSVVVQAADASIDWPILPPVHLPIRVQPRSIIEHFTLGNKVAGAFPMRTYERTLTFEQTQQQVTVQIEYPSHDATVDNNADINAQIVTQVEVYLEGNNGFKSQAYVTAGGIEQHNISLDIVANNVNMLHYFVLVFGKKDK